MTRDEILSMKPGRELDELVGEFMGYEYVPYQLNGRYVGKDYFINKDGEPLYDWSPSTDIAAAWEVEEEIARQNKHVAYCQALKIVLYSKDEYVGMFDCVHASPADRCKAALLAVTGEALVHELPGTNQC